MFAASHTALRMCTRQESIDVLLKNQLHLDNLTIMARARVLD